MKRRAMLKLSGAYAMGVPLLTGIKIGFTAPKIWQPWLQLLLDTCKIESKYELLYPGNLPKEELFDFEKATNKYFFYDHGQYCFTILEKSHDALGLLELALPVWKRESNESWRKLTSLSLFELEALAKAASTLTRSERHHIGDYLLPKTEANKSDETYATTQGAVSMISKVEEQGVFTTVRVLSNQDLILQDEFRSCHCLTCQI